MNRHRLSDPLLRMQTDERLAALAAHGGERAFAVLVERHRPALLAFARRLGTAGAAEDVVQQALLQAWSALGRGSRVEHVGAWLHRIVRNAAIRAAASAGGQDRFAELPATLVAATATADEVEMRQRTRDLLTEIERLPPRQREVLLRLAVDGSSGAEVGREMALEPNAVRQLAHRARMRLRTAMGAAVPWPLALWAARGFAAGGLHAIDGVPEAAGGGVAGAAGTTAGAGLLKVGAIATTTAAVAVGAVGLSPPHRHRHAAAASAPTQVLAATPAGGHGSRRLHTTAGTIGHGGAGAGSRVQARAVRPAPHGERHPTGLGPARSGDGGPGTGSGRDGGTRHDGGSGAGGHDGGGSGEHGTSGSGQAPQSGDGGSGGSSGDSGSATARPASQDGSDGGGDSHVGSGDGGGDSGSSSSGSGSDGGGSASGKSTTGSGITSSGD